MLRNNIIYFANKFNCLFSVILLQIICVNAGIYNSNPIVPLVTYGNQAAASNDCCNYPLLNSKSTYNSLSGGQLNYGINNGELINNRILSSVDGTYKNGQSYNGYGSFINNRNVLPPSYGYLNGYNGYGISNYEGPSNGQTIYTQPGISYPPYVSKNRLNECIDRSKDCALLASIGECAYNKATKALCPISCGTGCTYSNNDGSYITPALLNENNDNSYNSPLYSYIAPESLVTSFYNSPFGYSSNSPYGSAQKYNNIFDNGLPLFCRDSHIQGCKNWKELGYCNTKPEYMSTYCRATCGICNNNSQRGNEYPYSNLNTLYGSGKNGGIINIDNINGINPNLNSINGINPSYNNLNLLNGINPNLNNLNSINGINPNYNNLNSINGINPNYNNLNSINSINPNYNNLNSLNGINPNYNNLNSLNGINPNFNNLNSLNDINPNLNNLNSLNGIDNFNGLYFNEMQNLNFNGAHNQLGLNEFNGLNNFGISPNYDEINNYQNTKDFRRLNNPLSTNSSLLSLEELLSPTRISNNFLNQNFNTPFFDAKSSFHKKQEQQGLKKKNSINELELTNQSALTKGNSLTSNKNLPTLVEIMPTSIKNNKKLHSSANQAVVLRDRANDSLLKNTILRMDELRS